MTVDAERVLVWAPRGRDAALTIQLLAQHGLAAAACRGIAELVAAIDNVGCAVLAAEALDPSARQVLAAALAQQPPWSDFPLVLFAPRNVALEDGSLEEVRALGNITLLERPVHPGTLLSAVTAALRGRRRQYEAREAIHRRDQFLAMLGHELRNPLAAIVLATESLPRHALPAKPMEILGRQTRHLTRLVDDLLDVARVTSGRVRIDKVPVDLAEIVRRCVASAQLAPGAAAIEYVGPASGIVVDGDVVRLEEIFNNLIGNALKYSGTGSQITVRVKADDAACTVDVIDRGVGIAPDMLSRVFELFTQVEDTLARSKGGLGIGLTLVKALVELHGGTISAASAGPGQGSTFTVRLPCCVAVVRDSQTFAAVDAPRARRVVVVDDNADLLEMVSGILEAYGCEVATAPDGPSGLALLLAERPDIAFVDIGLPGIDGFRVAEQARAGHVDDTYLIAMSGYGQPDDQRRALAAGFDRHLTKPISAETLRDALRARHVADS